MSLLKEQREGLDSQTGNDLLKKVFLQLKPDEVDEHYRRSLQKKSKSCRFDGFRKGKAPLIFVERRYGKEVREESVQEMLEEAFEAHIHATGYRVSGDAVKLIQEGDPLCFVVHFEVYPELKLSFLSKVKIELPEVTVGESEVSMMLDRLRHQLATFTPHQESLAWGDQATLVMTVASDRKKSKSDAATEQRHTLLIHPSVSKHFDFDLKELIGLEVGKSRVISGSKKFRCTLESASRPELPPIDESFCKKLGIKEGKLESLRHELEHHMLRNASIVRLHLLRQRLMSAITEHYPFPVPNSRLKKEDEGKDDEAHLAQARYTMLLEHIIEKYQITSDTKREMELLFEIVSVYENVDEVLSDWVRDPKAMQRLTSLVLEERAIARLVEKIEIVNTPVQFFHVVEHAKMLAPSIIHE